MVISNLQLLPQRWAHTLVVLNMLIMIFGNCSAAKWKANFQAARWRGRFAGSVQGSAAAASHLQRKGRIGSIPGFRGENVSVPPEQKYHPNICKNGKFTYSVAGWRCEDFSCCITRQLISRRKLRVWFMSTFNILNWLQPPTPASKESFCLRSYWNENVYR